MENVILITESVNSLATIKSLSGLDLKQEGENVLHYSTTGQFLSIVRMANGIDEYDDETLTEIKLKIKKPDFFLLDTNNFDLLKKFIDALPNSFNFLIDNDFDSIMDKQEFMRIKGSKKALFNLHVARFTSVGINPYAGETALKTCFKHLVSFTLDSHSL